MTQYAFPLPSGTYNKNSNTWTKDQGVDIAAPAHTPLLAIADGTIVGHGIGGFGPSAPILKLATPAGTAEAYVYYGHAGPANMIPDGTQVKGGQTISEVGAGIVGISTGPHLEIGFCDAAGTPVAGTSQDMFKLLQGLPFLHNPLGALEAGQVPSGATISPGPLTPQGLANTGLSAIGQAVLDALGALWDTIKGSAVYAGLFVLLVFGGAVLVARGLRGSVESSSPNPEPKPA